MLPKITPEVSTEINNSIKENFNSNSAGLFYFWPFIKQFGIDEIIQKSGYPETKNISKLSSIMSFLTLKISNIKRYSADDLWCMDRGQGLFAGLNVLPKTACFSTYSNRITKEDNLVFLKDLHELWKSQGLLGDTINLDFTTIPYWGDDKHLENNWSGKRRQSLSSLLAVLAQDSDSGIIDYGDADILHKKQNAVVLEFLDFYRQDKSKDQLKYLVFDSKFTSYQNLVKLNDNGVKFLTIRRRGKKIVEEINNLPKSSWKTQRVACAGNKNRTLKINDSIISLKGYGGK